jgi:hypothetical protein
MQHARPQKSLPVPGFRCRRTLFFNCVSFVSSFGVDIRISQVTYEHVISRIIDRCYFYYFIRNSLVALLETLFARAKLSLLEKIPEQLEASFLIFLTLGSVQKRNTHWLPRIEFDSGKIAVQSDPLRDTTHSHMRDTTHSHMWPVWHILFFFLWFWKHNLGSKSLPRTVVHLLMLVDPLVENTVYILWAGLHPRAIQSQQERHDPFICVTCLTHAYLWHASFISRFISRWYEWVFATL